MIESAFYTKIFDERGYCKMKIITVCGSMKYKKEMMEITEKYALEGNCLITPIYLTKSLLMK